MTCRSVLLVLAALSINAQARLAPTTLDSLVTEAEVIVEAAPVKIERLTNTTDGAATLKVYRVWAGTLDSPEVKVEWGSEVHDQPITDLDKDYVLFLKKDKSGKYLAAQYGRSYWAFSGGRITDPKKADLDGNQRHFSYDYPVSMVTLTDTQKKTLFSEKEKGEKSPRIAVKALREFIAQKKKKP